MSDMFRTPAVTGGILRDAQGLLSIVRPKNQIHDATGSFGGCGHCGIEHSREQLSKFVYLAGSDDRTGAEQRAMEGECTTKNF